ncbi:MAG: Flp pilus assembly protein CpaB [Gemmataceae bacterium]
MKPRTLILMVVAVGCGLGASIMTSRLLAERRDKEKEVVKVPVLVAKTRVNGWAELKEPQKLFEIKQFPVDIAPKGAIGDFARLEKQKLNKNIGEGYPLTEADLLSKEQQNIADKLLPGQRATAIKVNAQSSVAGFVLPGSRVDVILTTRGGGSGNKATTRTILQHMLVMAVDNQDTRNPEMKSILGQTVTLAATPEEAARLALASSLGELTLQVKNPGDNSRTRPLIVREEDLDRPLLTGTTASTEEETAKPDKTLVELLGKLPEVPAAPVEEKKEEKPTPEVTAPKEPTVVRHTIYIQSGSRLEPHRFDLRPDGRVLNYKAPPKVIRGRIQNNDGRSQNFDEDEPRRTSASKSQQAEEMPEEID